MSDLQPLLARDRYTDEEWRLSSTGLCDREVEFGNGRGIIRCEKPSSPDSFYRWCGDHDAQARRDDPGAYGR